MKGKKYLEALIKALPFAGLIYINMVAIGIEYDLIEIKSTVLIVAVVVLFASIIALAMKSLDYFTGFLSAVIMAGALGILFIPVLAVLFVEHTITALYAGLFFAALLPPLFKAEPFTIAFSKKNYPEIIQKSEQFKKINLILNYIWAILFALSMGATLITYSESFLVQQLLMNLIPFAVMLGIGLPLTRKLPGLLMRIVPAAAIHFDTVEEMFQAMPLGLNRKRAAGLNVIFQFNLTGDQALTGYLCIKDQQCEFIQGTHSSPTLTINAPAKLWLDISNGEVSGDKAYLEKLFTVEGDATYLQDNKLAQLFSMDDDKSAAPPVNTEILGGRDFIYGTLEPKQIKKVLVLDGGPRSEAYSKSTLMAKKFCQGLESAGAEVEYVHLKSKEIKPCAGCYHCWTKTPGKCIYDDYMTEGLVKFTEADLTVFVTPLYVFSIIAPLKAFMDRMIPLELPYMVEANGVIAHPDRYENKKRGFVVFSAAGFPDLGRNFDSISLAFRNFSDHFHTMNLMAEFYLPAAEMIAQPVFRDRRKRIEQACYEAGRDAVLTGKIGQELTRTVSSHNISHEQFIEQSNNFWASLEGKKSFYDGTPRL